MSGYIGSKTSVTQVDGYNRTEAEAEFVQDPNGAITVSGSNVGIGTTDPLANLDVRTSSGTTVKIFDTSASASGPVLMLGTTDTAREEGDKIGGIEFHSSDGSSPGAGTRCEIKAIAEDAFNRNALIFSTADYTEQTAEAVRIGSSGALLVGTTSPIGAEKLGVSSTTEAAQFKNSAAGNGTVTAKNTNAGYADWIYTATTARGGGANCGFFRGIANNSINIFIYNNGNIVNANNSYGAISDVKLKENITDATPKLDKLNEVRVVNYNLTGQEQKQIGVIAQELEEIFPSMVEETVDRDEEGNDLGTTTKSVKYSVFVPMLIKAIQEQQAKIDDMETRLAALEAV
jgi:hypothetical protein